MIWSEICSAYELVGMFDREVYIESTHVITPESFVRALAQLDKSILPAKCMVPRYIPNTLTPTSSPPRTSSQFLL